MTAAVITLVIGLVGIAVLWVLRWRDTEAWRLSLVRYRLTLPGDLSVAEIAGWFNQLATITRPPRFSLRPALPVGVEDAADLLQDVGIACGRDPDVPLHAGHLGRAREVRGADVSRAIGGVAMEHPRLGV